MSLPRQVLPGKVYMVTRRCTQRQFLLKPSKEVNRAFLFCLAFAAQATGVQVHVVMVMSNHYHLIVTDVHGNIPKFTYLLNKFTGKSLNATYGRWENLWAANEQPSYVELADADAALASTLYAIVNPVEAGLVSSSDKWPGLCIWQPGTYEVERPTAYFEENGAFPKTLSLELTLPPLPSTVESASELGQLVASTERLIRRFRKAKGLGFLGVKKVLRQSIYDSPQRPAPKRRISPRVATKNKWRRIEVLGRLRAFVAKYRQAMTRWLLGDRTVVFPAGTYAMRLTHRVRVAEL